MSRLNINKLHQSQIEQLTGLKYSCVYLIAQSFRSSLASRGRPHICGPLATVILSLIKLRANLTVRSMESITGIDSVTISRCVNRCIAFLSKLSFLRKSSKSLLIDSTSIRVATTSINSYYGHKHQRCSKVQLICDSDGSIVDTSMSYAGSVHDKTIYNKESDRLKSIFNSIILADKAYAGANGENLNLLRPIKRNEASYKANKEGSKKFNRDLSKIRVKVEHVFARIKTWNVLKGIFPFNANRCGEVVKAIAVLHNLNRFDVSVDMI
jgi:DDE superfamily endonuclease